MKANITLVIDDGSATPFVKHIKNAEFKLRQTADCVRGWLSGHDPAEYCQTGHYTLSMDLDWSNEEQVKRFTEFSAIRSVEQLDTSGKLLGPPVDFKYEPYTGSPKQTQHGVMDDTTKEIQQLVQQSKDIEHELQKTELHAVGTVTGRLSSNEAGQNQRNCASCGTLGLRGQPCINCKAMVWPPSANLPDTVVTKLRKIIGQFIEQGLDRFAAKDLAEVVTARYLVQENPEHLTTLQGEERDAFIRQFNAEWEFLTKKKD